MGEANTLVGAFSGTVIYADVVEKLKKDVTPPKDIFELLYENQKAKENHASLSHICYQILEADLNIGALFYAISFFKNQSASNLLDAYKKFKESHLTRIKDNYYAKQDGKDERKLFHLALQYSMMGSDDIFFDMTEKDNVIYYMTHGKKKSEAQHSEDGTKDNLVQILG